MFSIKEEVFKELCLEFFSTVSFEANTVDPYYVHALVFFVLVVNIMSVAWPSFLGEWACTNNKTQCLPFL